MIHAGQLIERTFREQGRTVTWLVTQLCCTRPSTYRIFREESIDIHLFWRISCIFGRDSLRDLSDSISTGNFPSVSKQDTIPYRSWSYAFTRQCASSAYLCRRINI